MALIELTVNFKRSGTTKTLRINSDDLTMGLVLDAEEAKASGSYTKLITAYADEVGLSLDELRQLKQGDFKRIVQAIQDAATEANDPK
jgi:hypothetical protein